MCTKWQSVDRQALQHTKHVQSIIFNQSINHSICIRRHNSSVEITSQRRRGEPRDQSRVNRWVFRARENCSVKVAVLTFGGSWFHVVAAAMVKFAILLNSTDTWSLTEANWKCLEAFQHVCLKRTVNITWKNKVKNEHVQKDQDKICWQLQFVCCATQES